MKRWINLDAVIPEHGGAQVATMTISHTDEFDRPSGTRIFITSYPGDDQEKNSSMMLALKDKTSLVVGMTHIASPVAMRSDRAYTLLIWGTDDLFADLDAEASQNVCKDEIRAVIPFIDELLTVRRGVGMPITCYSSEHMLISTLPLRTIPDSDPKRLCTIEELRDVFKKYAIPNTNIEGQLIRHPEH